ncbi:MAG: SDR family NAD(P)-dependent oxidoreductase [Eubacteriales bacterium]
MAKNAIVTGGSRGIGRDIVKRLAKMGYNVVIDFVSDTSQKLASDLVSEIKSQYGVEGVAVQADVAEYNSCKRIVDTAVKNFGSNIDVLVNNAAISNGISFLKLTPEQYTRLINVNLMGCIHCSHLVMPYMVKANEGCIVNISSIGGLVGVSSGADYSASKGGVIAITRSLALEFGKYNIRVNSVAPGFILTDMLKKAGEEGIEKKRKTVPLKGIGEVGDISQCVEYLVNAKYVTGQTISPNGGVVMP